MLTPPDDQGPLDNLFTMTELDDALHLCNAKSAPGPDGILYSAIRTVPHNGKEALLDYYNNIRVTRDIPLGRKEEWVKPILKPGKLLNAPPALRPISLTSTIVKTFEHMVARRLNWQLEKDHVFTPVETGFRTHLSTSDSLLMITPDLESAKQPGGLGILLLMDVTKAL